MNLNILFLNQDIIICLFFTRICRYEFTRVLWTSFMGTFWSFKTCYYIKKRDHLIIQRFETTWGWGNDDWIFIFEPSLYNFMFLQSLRGNDVCSIHHSSSWPSLNNVILFHQIFHCCPHLCSITSKCQWLHVHLCVCVCECQCLSLLRVLFLFRHPVLLCFPSHSFFSLKIFNSLFLWHISFDSFWFDWLRATDASSAECCELDFQWDAC